MKIVFITSLFTLSCAGVMNTRDKSVKVIKDVSSCQPTIDPKSPRPAVCGKCQIKIEDGKLIIEYTERCPQYEVYRCTKKDGKTFLINNLRCEPVD